MKRYTACLRILDSALDAAQIKQAIEGVLLRQPITFRLGAVAPTKGNVILVEIASDAKRTDLFRI